MSVCEMNGEKICDASRRKRKMKICVVSKKKKIFCDHLDLNLDRLKNLNLMNLNTLNGVEKIYGDEKKRRRRRICVCEKKRNDVLISKMI